VSDPPAAPAEDLRRVDDAQARLMATIGSLSDGQVDQATRLPGWTVGHLLTHVARNADSHRRRAEATATGDVIDQYPGGPGGRAAEIEAGAGRSAAELLDDVRRSAEAMDAAWRVVPDGAWGHRTRDVGGRERPLFVLPSRRWQELEVHLVDLDLGATMRDWPDAFVSAWLPGLRAEACGRLPEGAVLPAPGALDAREELAWLYGRVRRDDLPELAPWQ